MLTKLTIKNVALIESAEIEFDAGLNVLSGETGAGKSVILDSVNFVLGAKADRTMIRYGETECMVKAEFFVPEHSKAVSELRELDIDSDGEIIISRKFSDLGKSSIKINGCTVNATMLRRVTDSLVDVHGQSEHFFLLKESNQLKLLDSVVGEALTAEKTRLKSLLQEKKEIEEQIALLGGDAQSRERLLDVLKFQIEEIESVDLREGEEEELLSERIKINNMEKILSALQGALSALAADGGVSDCLRGANRSMTAIAHLDSEYQAICDRMESIFADTEDVIARLEDLSEDTEFDEKRAEEIELRLDCIRSLKRKYGADKATIDAFLRKAKNDYEMLSDCDARYAILSERLESLNEKIYAKCRDLTKLRREHGSAFCERVTKELRTLNIANAEFDISFKAYTQKDTDRATTNGLDEITFLFSANAGEPMKELGRIISGGEMSRLMLAIKTQTSDINEISTYIFDEIDAGISGKTAKVVGEKLAQIARDTQILAVSHLAQIAVMSDHEFLIEKQETDGKTLTRVHVLDQCGKTNEIVRLLGGDVGDEYASKHAEELLKQADEYKRNLR